MATGHLLYESRARGATKERRLDTSSAAPRRLHSSFDSSTGACCTHCKLPRQAGAHPRPKGLDDSRSQQFVERIVKTIPPSTLAKVRRIAASYERGGVGDRSLPADLWRFLAAVAGRRRPLALTALDWLMIEATFASGLGFNLPLLARVGQWIVRSKGTWWDYLEVLEAYRRGTRQVKT